MNTFSPILTALPPPAVIAELSLETILAELKAELATPWPQYTAWVESDPAMQLLRVAAYRELLLRNLVNWVARANLLAFATGSDLDHLAAFYGVARQEGEEDAALRQRVQLRIQASSTAGTRHHYRFHALQAATMRDVLVDSPEAGVVRVVVLSEEGDGAPAEELLQAVVAAVTAEDVRAVCDVVRVVPAEIVTTDIHLQVWLQPNAPLAVIDILQDAIPARLAEERTLGWDLTTSWIHGQAHRMAGVQRVNVVAPTGDVVIQPHQCVALGTLTVDYAGRMF